VNLEDFFQTFAFLERLERQPRSGWHQAGVRLPENVAAHSYGVAMISMWICDYLRAEGREVDVELVLRMALLHDVEESVTGDIPKPVKSQFSDIDTVEGLAQEKVLNATPSWKMYLREYSARQSLASRIVKAADVLQMQMMAVQYERESRLDLSAFFRSDIDHGIAIANAISHRIIEIHRKVISSPPKIG